ncbi:uncharacterized protein [Spinacia oleracea]|uniref:Uncharacterized protein isoform X1 n=1 Tax=Spinacia oleracea TaxID=3562 RepID=A0A9R0JIL4_SPIOL|nr:uncharacterized protein LOC110805930 isoform X1 [Spinacia oleracea]
MAENELRESEMVLPSNGKPSLTSSKQSQTLFNPPPNPDSTKPISPVLKSLSSRVHFYGWRYPLKNWNSWVEKLRPSFESTWKKASIFEAIMASTLEIPKCRESIFALTQKWCPENSSFVMPWGEVTITLEDVLILGGFSVTGDSVLSQICSKELLEIENSLLAGWSELTGKARNWKASEQQWMDNWMGTRQEFEHQAFLSFWLSRYVLPLDDCTINKSVFHIAVLLSRGKRIALAPAVLATIYRNLRLLKEQIENFNQVDGNLLKLKIWAPFQLLQAWFWERFPKFSPKCNPDARGFCRLERWHKVKVLRNEEVGLFTDVASDDFRWRPYSNRLNNWSIDHDFESCIRVSQLVGLDYIELYFPNRVALQFGLDQERMRSKVVLNNEVDVPPGFSPKGKRVASDGQYKPNSKRSRQSPALTVEDDDSDDDHRTLAEVFGLTGTKREIRNGKFPMMHQQSPICFAGDNSKGTPINIDIGDKNITCTGTSVSNKHLEGNKDGGEEKSKKNNLENVADDDAQEKTAECVNIKSGNGLLGDPMIINDDSDDNGGDDVKAFEALVSEAEARLSKLKKKIFRMQSTIDVLVFGL